MTFNRFISRVPLANASSNGSHSSQHPFPPSAHFSDVFDPKTRWQNHGWRSCCRRALSRSVQVQQPCAVESVPERSTEMQVLPNPMRANIEGRIGER